MDAILTPTPVLRLREEATSSTSYSTGTDGCVVCPTDVSTCPSCPAGQECNLKAQTCSSCPEYVCVDSTSSGSGSSTPIGGIVGGVVGGVAVISALLFLYYKFVYRKKHPRLRDDSDYDSKYEMDDSGGFDDTLSSGGEKAERPVAVRTQSASSVAKNHRLSSYESFMRPPGYNKRAGASRSNVQRRAQDQRAASQDGRSPYMDKNEAKRNSVATTISTTNASNILPIAYIPGVTIRETKNNTRSIFSNDSDSVFSDVTGLENASIVQDRSGPPTKSTMTAIRAQPKLVNVTRIDENIEEENEDDLDDDDVDDVDDAGDVDEVVVDGFDHVDAVDDVGSNNHEDWSAGLANGDDADGDSDSDVDSDIGEIHRANSTRRAPRHSPVYDGHEDQPFVDGTLDDTETMEENDDKSFVLDIGRAV